MNEDLKKVLLHLRFPFSILLLPVFLLTLTQFAQFDKAAAIYLFLILHVLVYPASNGYNSYMDNDTGSIGGIKHPPKVPQSMFVVTVIMDALALGLTYVLFGIEVAGLLLAYILASRAYSYRGIRLKKYAVLGFLTVTIFQGPVIYLVTTLALGGKVDYLFSTYLLIAISFLLIGAGYPLSQIYQHEQDRADGVHTLSMLLGIRGTFIFSGILFALQGAAVMYYFGVLKESYTAVGLYLVCLAPVFFHFNKWMLATFKDDINADYDNTMKMNKMGALAINTFFILITLLLSRI